MDSEALKQQAAIVAQLTQHQTALRAYIAALMPGKTGVSDPLSPQPAGRWRHLDEKGNSFQ